MNSQRSQIRFLKVHTCTTFTTAWYIVLLRPALPKSCFGAFPDVEPCSLARLAVVQPVTVHPGEI